MGLGIMGRSLMIKLDQLRGYDQVMPTFSGGIDGIFFPISLDAINLEIGIGSLIGQFTVRFGLCASFPNTAADPFGRLGVRADILVVGFRFANGVDHTFRLSSSASSSSLEYSDNGVLGNRTGVSK